MKPGQIEKLQELDKCYMRRRDWSFVKIWLADWLPDEPMGKYAKADLRRLWHQYQPQIRAMRRNRNKTAPV